LDISGYNFGHPRTLIIEASTEKIKKIQSLVSDGGFWKRSLMYIPWC